ncbi:class I SAM-dependent RNA methyltransferase [Wenxinia marina]|uniref:23S rRNA methyltransferase n=1 Tax=Wenxinia marina DSM 24838 TaxID=1123501 RepID=A0A0D0Q9C7_9RHOB|nr:class I SAM-dependent RNA methyltransferase [Wenxinia marina]KIQ71029.1 23S rRNA methyltransferase [Wenxinia marina DSM 24838]GGL55455.1 RNA methyltransferase [Wenxinia marina]
MLVRSLTRQALGRCDDGTLVPRVLPGEDVALAEDVVRIVTPSPDRVAPPCRHYRTCGGCALQHASDAFVADWKREVVVRALAARGIEAEVGATLTSPPDSRRRARFAGRRTKSGAMVGFHARGSDTVIDTPDCRLVLPQIVAVRPALEALARLAASRRGEAGLTVTWSEGGADILVETERALDDTLRSDLGALAEAHDLARLTWGDEPVAQRRPPAQRMGPALVVPPPGAFLQATREGEVALVAEVLDATKGARRVADLFAGCGTFTLPLAEAAEVHAVEGAAPMLAALDRGWREAPGPKRVTTEARDLFRRPLLRDELGAFDAVVLDPPRAGAEAQVAEIAAARVPHVAMVSCNPVTFARDAEQLVAAGYALGRVQVIDQFRWSDHVEIATRFTIQ